MFLKSIKIKNFRKFYDNKEIEFVSGKNVQDISKVTTLIIGKNNVGKTTIMTFIDKLINKEFNAQDFNFKYLKELIEKYKNNNFDELPTIECSLLISLDNENANIGPISDFLPICETINEIKINIKFYISEKQEFEEEFKKEILTITDEYIQFYKFLDLINRTKFKIEYFRDDDSLVENFKIKDLIEIQKISANKPVENNTLSMAFKKIIQFKYENEGKNDIEESIEKVNETITKKIAKGYIEIVNNAFNSINNNRKYQMHLNGNVGFDDIFKNLIRYEYIENGNYIPEEQFGLGYKNLMIIISEIIDFIQKYPNKEQSKINLIFIEEPENYMHPQMQEMFIKYINEAVESILKDTNKKINSQLVIITHSSHIVNSKIHYANSFDNIVYLYESKENKLQIVNLKDENICKNEFLPFLKKHIKFEVSNIFFADAVIVVEGLVEDIIIKYFLENHPLRNYYITIFKIDGAHAFKYDELFKLLNIPVLIITDLDIKREKIKVKSNKKINFIEDSNNIKNLKYKTTSNNTLIYYYKSLKKIIYIEKFKIKYLKTIKKRNLDKYIAFIKRVSNKFNNIYITTQIEPINGYYATSFEEAFVLTNFNKQILITTLKDIKPRVYKQYLLGKYQIDISKSYKIQKMLGNDGNKGNFAISLLENMVNEENYNLKLPKYIEDGLNWLLYELER